MAAIENLCFGEPISIDGDRVSILLRDLGSAGAERVISRAANEISDRLLLVETSWAESDFCRLRRTAQSLIAISDQVGMHLLAHVACDVASLSDGGDDPALAATIARLQRVGEGSLSAMWAGQEFRL